MKSPTSAHVSVRSLLARFRVKIALTMALVGLEAIATLLFPLFLGLAINGLLEESLEGVLQLAALALIAVALGSGRRFYDTRAYSDIYATTAAELVERERDRGTSVSATAARVKLLGEFVQFLETSLPGVATAIINLVGTLVVLATINLPIFWGCLGLCVVGAVQYSLTGGLNYRLNAGYNDELEQQVDVLESDDRTLTAPHFRRLMRWSIKLSDLETANYAFLFLGVIALLVFAPIALVDGPTAEYGLVFAALMYVLQFIDGLAVFPFYVQEMIRLQEITARLRHEPETHG